MHRLFMFPPVPNIGQTGDHHSQERELGGGSIYLPVQTGESIQGDVRHVGLEELKEGAGDLAVVRAGVDVGICPLPCSG